MRSRAAVPQISAIQPTLPQMLSSQSSGNITMNMSVIHNAVFAYGCASAMHMESARTQEQMAGIVLLLHSHDFLREHA